MADTRLRHRQYERALQRDMVDPKTNQSPHPDLRNWSGIRLPCSCIGSSGPETGHSARHPPSGEFGRNHPAGGGEGGDYAVQRDSTETLPLEPDPKPTGL